MYRDWRVLPSALCSGPRLPGTDPPPGTGRAAAGDFNESFHPVHILRAGGFNDCFTRLSMPLEPTHPCRPSCPKEDALVRHATQRDAPAVRSGLLSGHCPQVRFPQFNLPADCRFPSRRRTTRWTGSRPTTRLARFWPRSCATPPSGPPTHPPTTAPSSPSTRSRGGPEERKEGRGRKVVGN